MKPAGVRHRNVSGDVSGPLAGVAELHPPPVDAGDELRRLRFEPIGVPAAARDDVRAPLAQRAAPVGEQIARLVVRARPSADAVLDRLFALLISH